VPELLRISGKDLGSMALADMCERCFWIKRHAEKGLPYQIFPGIFSSIDSYTKKVVHQYFDEHGAPPPWLAPVGDVVGYNEPPHYSKFQIRHESTGILLTGALDAILKCRDGSIILADYKTARYTANTDSLLPVYEVQLNAYAFIASQLGWPKVSGLALIYAEPMTESHHAAPKESGRDDGFAMRFHATIKPLTLDLARIERLLDAMKELLLRPSAPACRANCKDCERLEGLIALGGERIASRP
jgi:hypothetical protein